MSLKFHIPFVLSGFANIKKLQKTFNVDNGLRVHQRGGFKDKILYNFTLGMLVIGGGLWVSTVYDMAMPKK